MASIISQIYKKKMVIIKKTRKGKNEDCKEKMKKDNENHANKNTERNKTQNITTKPTSTDTTITLCVLPHIFEVLH